MAAAARLLADQARAAMLTALADGRALPAGELARLGNVAASTATFHLGRLADAGWVAAERCGRHRYYRLANPAVIDLVERLARSVPRKPADSLHISRPPADLSFARTCYDHLAGRLGVGLARALVDHHVIIAQDGTYQLAPQAGKATLLGTLGVDLQTVSHSRRPLTRACLDWSERRHHLAGALGAALTRQLFHLRWIERKPGSRAVELTSAGSTGLAQALGLEAPDGSQPAQTA